MVDIGGLAGSATSTMHGELYWVSSGLADATDCHTDHGQILGLTAAGKIFSVMLAT